MTRWVVRTGDDLYVRSVNGRSGHGFRGAQERHEGRIHASGVQRDVTFLEAERDLSNDIDETYRAKYPPYAGPVTSKAAGSGLRWSMASTSHHPAAGKCRNRQSR